MGRGGARLIGLGWDPPAWPALLAGAVALAAWLAIARPGAGDAARGVLRTGAAALLALALLDVGCRLAAGGERPRLAVLLDVSESMRVPESGTSRASDARDFLASAAFREWSAGWEVVVDSFGGATTDPGAAIRSAAAGSPDAILVVSDGRATAGLGPAGAEAPVWAYAPGPVSLADAAVLDVAVERDASGPDRAVVEVGAIGGRDVVEGLEVELAVDGREAGRIAVGALAAGDRRRVRVPLPDRDAGAVIEARLRPLRDGVPANDVRSVVDAGPDVARRALVAGLAPGWEMGPWRRAVAAAREGAVDAVWVAPDGTLRPVDGGASRSWAGLDPARYRSLHLVGDPARLGAAGRAWVDRFGTLGGRGILWMPEGAAGEVAGVTVAEGSAAGPPSETEAGRAWRVARGVDRPGPDAGAGWPVLERLPGTGPPPRATVLVEAAGRPAAWIEEREAARVAVLAGTGWYRWPIETAGPAGPAPAFWAAWTDALVRWLDAAPSAERPLVGLPADGRVAAGAGLVAPIAAGVEEALRWRVTDVTGAVVDSGEVAAPAGGETIRVAPLAPGAYRLEAEAGDGWRGGGRFVVEASAPDLARTEADTAALAGWARRSGGRLLDGPPTGRLPAPAASPEGAPAAASTRGLGTRPWAYLAAALLLLADWAIGARALARPETAR